MNKIKKFSKWRSKENKLSYIVIDSDFDGIIARTEMSQACLMNLSFEPDSYIWYGPEEEFLEQFVSL